MSTEGLTLDRFLGGRVTAAQPTGGFRAGHDTVLLAAAVPARNGSVVLELGSGTGVASLCLAARVPGVRITGLEIDPELVRLANENASRNGVADRVSFRAANLDSLSWPAKAGHPGDEGLAWPPDMQLPDHVFFNPPFHPDTGQSSPVIARDRATRDSRDAVRTWTEKALSLVNQGGTVTAIVRADRTNDILDAAKAFGGIIFPLFPRAGAQPKRAIVRIVKMERASLIDLSSLLEGEGGAKRRKGGDAERSARFVTTAGLILHEADGRNTDAAEAVLRHAAALDLAP